MKVRKPSFSLVPALIGLSVAALVAWGVSHLSGFGFWPFFAIVVVAMLINGFVAEAEDDAPVGFNHPLPRDQSQTPSQAAPPNNALQRTSRGGGASPDLDA